MVVFFLAPEVEHNCDQNGHSDHDDNQFQNSKAVLFFRYFIHVHVRLFMFVIIPLIKTPMLVTFLLYCRY